MAINKIEIQILSPATRQQLIELRDKLRVIEGMEGFELQIPALPPQQGKMDGGTVEEIVLHALLGGVLHATTAVSFEYLIPQISAIFKSVIKNSVQPLDAEHISMGNDKAKPGKVWEAVVTLDRNEQRSDTYINSDGENRKFSNREFSITPSKTHAVLIGTSVYDDSSHFSAIPPIANNITAMFKVLHDKRLVGLPMKNIHLLSDKGSVEIKVELGKISKLPGIETLIIYYAGHGQNMGQGQLSLIARDTHNIDEELHNDIPYAFIERIVKSSLAAQKIILIDACHSGLATQSGNGSFDFEPVSGSFTLASTSAEESSYFKKEDAYTYFTAYLLELFNEGIVNSNKMLSLDDLYQHTRKKLVERQLPAPTCRLQLQNVKTDKFYISANPGFSLQALLRKPKQLYEQGNYGDAKKEYLQLLREYPENGELNREYLDFDRNYVFNKLVKEGDALFFALKNFEAALRKYEEALDIKYDEGVKDKIIDCKNRTGAKAVYKEPESKLWNSLKLGVPKFLKAGVVVLAVLAIVVFIFVRKKKDLKAAANPVINAPDTVDYRKLLQLGKNYYNASKFDSAYPALFQCKEVIDPEAWCFLGEMYSAGLGAKYDSVEAVKWFSKAANQGNNNAKLMLGECYTSGYPVPFDSALIISWVDSAVSRGEAKAQSVVGLMHITGIGKKEDFKQAMRFLHLAADKNDPFAEVMIAVMYKFATDEVSNKEEAALWLAKAAEQGYSTGEYMLGGLYKEGDKGVKKNLPEAFKLFSKAADQGLFLAKYELGNMYENGTGVNKNQLEAINWYKKAAAQGSADAKKALKRLGVPE